MSETLIRCDCINHLNYNEGQSTEPHGERTYSVWWTCGMCGRVFTDQEAQQLSIEQDVLNG